MQDVDLKSKSSSSEQETSRSAMYKLNIPLSVILSSGGLILLGLGSLLLVANSAHTSDIKPAFESKSIENVSPLVNARNFESSENNEDSISRFDATSSPVSRRRDGRMYSRSSYDGGQQVSQLENFATAYGSAQATPQEQSPDLNVQANAQSNEASSFASFGETSPLSSVSGSSRHTTPNEYSSAHNPYYANFMNPSSSGSAYSSQQSAASSNVYPHHSFTSGAGNHYPSHYTKSSHSLPLGYPTNGYDRTPLASYYDRSYMTASPSHLWGSSSSGLMSSASTALSHWAGGFSIGEIVCAVIAIAIGAVILGAPFFLIYLALMGNFSGSGTLSLTNPTGGATPAGGAAASVNGRRKRLAIYEQLNSLADRKGAFDFTSLANSIANGLSPHLDVQQVASSFKKLVNSIEKYAQPEPVAPVQSIKTH